MEYTLHDLEEFDDDIDFVQWLQEEGFVNLEGVLCDYCGTEMELQGNMLKIKFGITLFCISLSLQSVFKTCGWSHLKVS
jgi:hypothetical protein